MPEQKVNKRRRNGGYWYNIEPKAKIKQLEALNSGTSKKNQPLGP